MARKRTAPPVVERVLVYRDESMEWRWRAYGGNGKVVGDSGEGYRNRSYAAKVAHEMYPSADLELASKRGLG